MIYLLLNLGFVINLKNSVPHPIQKTEFLGMTIDLVEMSVPTSGEGSTNLQKLTGYIFNARGVNKRPSKAFGNIITKALAIIPVTHEVPAETANSQPLFEKRLQQQSSSRCTLQGGTKLVDITLSLSNGRPVISHQVERLIQSDALKTVWGSFSQKSSIAVWSQPEQALHINIIQLRAAKFVILTFCRSKKNLGFHVQMDYQALAYLVKMRDKKPTHDSGGKRNMGIWFSQSDYTIPVGDFKYQGRQSIRIPTFCSYRESVSQSNEVQVYVDHNNTSVALVHPVI